MDDDDVYVNGGISYMRRWAARNPGRIGIFKRAAEIPQNTRWRTAELSPGNVSPPMFLIPNIAGKLAEWGPLFWRDPDKQAALEASGVERWSDAYYVERTAAAQDSEVIFVDFVTGLARPSPWWRRLRYRLRLGRLKQFAHG